MWATTSLVSAVESLHICWRRSQLLVSSRSWVGDGDGEQVLCSSKLNAFKKYFQSNSWCFIDFCHMWEN
jgi:hypothetical protein